MHGTRDFEGIPEDGKLLLGLENAHIKEYQL